MFLESNVDDDLLLAIAIDNNKSGSGSKFVKDADVPSFQVFGRKFSVPKLRWGQVQINLTNPFDVIKTRLQISSDVYGGSITNCAMAVLEEGGPKAFLRGSVPRLIHKIPANGFFFVFYEFFQRVLRVE